MSEAAQALIDPFKDATPGDRYPGVVSVLEKLPYPYLLLVKDPGGLYCRENLVEKDPSLELAASTLCLLSLMIAGWMLENDGPERAGAFSERLACGLRAFVEDEARYGTKE